MKSKHLLSLLAVLAALALLAACGGGSGNDDNASASSSASAKSSSSSAASSAADASKYVGTWTLAPDDGGSPMYVDFSDDGAARMGKTPDNLYIKGTYKINSTGLVADMTNPRVGQCRLVCLDEDTSLLADFIEYWHTPEKHIAFTATK